MFAILIYNESVEISLKIHSRIFADALRFICEHYSRNFHHKIHMKLHRKFGENSGKFTSAARALFSRSVIFATNFSRAFSAICNSFFFSSSILSSSFFFSAKIEACSCSSFSTFFFSLFFCFFSFFFSASRCSLSASAASVVGMTLIEAHRNLSGFFPGKFSENRNENCK